MRMFRTNRLPSVTGSIVSNGKLATTVGLGIHDLILLKTNIPYHLIKVRATRSTTQLFSLPLAYFVERAFERGRIVTNVVDNATGDPTFDATGVPVEGGGIIPIPFVDIDAKTMDGQMSGALIVDDTSNATSFFFDLGTLPEAPTEGWFFEVHTRNGDSYRYVLQNGEMVRVPRRYTEDLKVAEFRKNAPSGLYTFDAFQRGPGIDNRRIVVEGEVLDIKFVAKKGGQIIDTFETTKEMIDFILQSENENKYTPRPDRLVLDFTAAGFAIADLSPTDYDEMQLVLNLPTAQELNIYQEYIQKRTA